MEAATENPKEKEKNVEISNMKKIEKMKIGYSKLYTGIFLASLCGIHN